MDKQELYDRAIVDYRTGNYSWHCLKRKYYHLSVGEIFLQVIAKTRCSIKLRSHKDTTR